MTLEAEFLANLNHPNIIKLRGLTLSGAAGFANGPCGYFLIIDRLFETLDQMIKRWHGQTGESTETKEPTAIKKGRMSSISTKITNALPKTFKTKKHTGKVNKVETKRDEVMDECLSVGKCMPFHLQH